MKMQYFTKEKKRGYLYAMDNHDNDRASKLNILNDIAVTASFPFNYLLLFYLFKHLDATVKITIFHLYLTEKFDNGQYGLSRGFCGYKAMFFELLTQQNFSK